MSVGTGIILGLLIGALAMLLADWFFYRNRRICVDAEGELRETNNLLIYERDNLKNQLKSFDGQAGRVGALEADLNTRTKQYNLLLSDHEEAARRYRDLETRYKSNENRLGQLGDLQTSLREKDAEIEHLQAALDARDGELNELNIGFKEMGLVAGGAAGLAALRSQLNEQDDESRQVRHALEERDAEIAHLRTNLETRDGEVSTLRGEVNGLRDTVDLRDLELADLRAELHAKDVELGNLRGQMDELSIGLDEMGIATGGAVGGIGLLAALRSRFGKQDEQANELQASLQTRDAELASLQAILVERDEEIGRLRGQLSGEVNGLREEVELRDLELADLRAELHAKDVELGNLRGQMDELSIGLDEMGIAAGGGIGLLAALRSRFGKQEDDVNQLQASLDARNAELADLQRRLEERNSRIIEMDVALSEQSADINALNATHQDELATLTAELTIVRKQLSESDAQLAEVNAEVDNLDVDWGKMGLITAGAAAGGGLLARLRGLGKRVNEQERELTATAEADPIELDPYVIELQGSLSERENELTTLLARWEAQSAEISNLRNELEARDSALTELHSSQTDKFEDLQLQIMLRDDDLAELRQQLEEREAEVERIRAEASARSAELQRINVELDNCASEFNTLRAELDSRGASAAEIESLRAAVSNRDTEILSLRAQLDSVESELDDVNMSWLAGAGALGAGSAVIAMKKRIRDLEAEIAQRDGEIISLQESANKPDDLTKIWGIGPAIAGKFNDNGIYTFEQLARTERHEIDTILAGSGGRFRLATPSVRATWQEQARLAAVGDWDEFDLLHSRVRNEKPDDLTRIWGLDEQIERSLVTRGIDTYRELKEVQYEEVLPELQIVQMNYPHYSKREIYNAWVQQARWAMNEDWQAINSQLAALETPPEPDDLTKIWGIGKGLEGILNTNGIYTFEQLAEIPEEQLDAIIDRAGSRYRIATQNLHNTWATQAEMAAADDWEALENYQDQLSWSDDDEA